MGRIPAYVTEKIWLESYPPLAREELAFPEDPVFSLVDKQARNHPERVALLFQGKEITLGELEERINACACSLRKMAVSRGDRVAIYLPNCPAFVVIYFGAMKAGAAVTAISPLAVPREIDFQLKDSGAKILFAFDQYLPKIESLGEGLRLQEKVAVPLTFQDEVKRDIPDSWIDFNMLLGEKGDPPTLAFDLRRDLAILQYTGGTTGLPKGAMLSHFNILANVVQTSHWDRAVLRRFKLDHFVKAAVLPWYHIYGQTVDMSCGICNGHKLVVFPRFEPAEFLKGIERHRIQIVTGAPPIFIRLINEPAIEKTDLSSLIWCSNGAGPIPVEVINKFEKLTKGVTIHEGFGLSEASPVTNSTSPAIKQKKGSVGVPYPGCVEAIWDLKNGDFAPLNVPGELLVAGPQVMLGYWNRPEETENTFLEIEGLRWLRTGDIARMDQEGYVWIVDRAKDLIKYKGHSVYPREVEEVLHEHPGVLEAAVVGIPDPETIEKIKAFVVLKTEARGRVSPEELISWTKERLSGYKCPGLVEIREDLPKSHAGKYLKRQLR